MHSYFNLMKGKSGLITSQTVSIMNKIISHKQKKKDCYVSK